jgi:hypothetical protein
MISFQDAFANSTLNVVLADTSIAFPYDDDIQGDDWLTALKSTDVERSVAFFGGSLQKSDYVQLLERFSAQTRSWSIILLRT